MIAIAGGLLLGFGLALPASAEMATLQASPGSRINVRSQPSTSAPAPSYGIPGDRVQILNTTRGTDGYTWHYVEFPQSNIRGWVRSDLLALDESQRPLVQRVSFAPGTASANVSGSVRSYETRDYLLHARARQRMTVDLHGNSNFLQVAVFNPQGETVYVGTNWTGMLPRSGDYLVRVGLVRAEARRNGIGDFSLTLGIR